MNQQLRLALSRVEAVANGRMINATYRLLPDSALDAFKADLKLLVKTIRDR